ncbi:MAG: hypothetical protein GY941_17505 [Planctomycetes bacterium]|nr:hypothetical protein [Planctomycetota bacterium]
MTNRIKTSWDDHYMRPAFLGFVSYCSKDPDHIKQFKADTGYTYSPADTSLGRDLVVAQSFVDWCETLFGTSKDLGDKDEPLEA